MNATSKPSRQAPAASLQVVPQRLNSWKEIASYFDRDIRTVQFWEKKEGLPVHRHEHDSRSSVYALPSELEIWFAHRRKRPFAPEPEPAPSNSPEAPDDAATVLPFAPHMRSLAPQSVVGRVGLVLAALAIGSLTTLATLRLHRLSSANPANATTAKTAAVSPSQPFVLAVLPFQDISSASGHDLWVDGLTDDLITEFGRNSSLEVISGRSTMQLRDTHEPIASIASRLHASLLLEGTVAHTKDQIRVTVQLIDATHDRELWSQRYTRAAGDILSIQDEVASSITAAVTDKITGKPLPFELAQTSQHNVDSQTRLDYLTGNFFLNQRDEPGLLQAIDYFHRAIARDPNYAPAYAGLADCYNLLSVWGHMTSAEGFPQSREAALAALRLDPKSAEAYTALAFETFRYEWNFPHADAYFRKAIELNPNYAPAHHWYGQYLVDLRQFGPGLEELRKARDLDPLSPIMASDLADGYIYARRYDEAIAELKQIIQLYPNFVPAHDYLTAAYAAAGRIDDAAREAEINRQVSGDDGKLRFVRLQRLIQQRDLTQARREAQAFIREMPHYPVKRADLFFSIGDKEAGYAQLEQAIQERDWWMVTLSVDPTLDSVRQEPRFLAIQKRVGLPTGSN
jgi:TolB-like protein/Tfp pilus assembly protein PilF